MATLTLTDTRIDKISTDALVVGTARDGDRLILTEYAQQVDRAMKGRLSEALEGLGATGRDAEVIKVPTLGTAKVKVVVATGLGAAPRGDDFPAEAVRRAAGAAIRSLAGTPSVAVALPQPAGEDPVTMLAAAEGALLAAYRFDRYRTGGAEAVQPPVGAVTLVVAEEKDRATRAAAKRAEVLARAVHLARDLVNTAPNHLHPVELAEAAAKAARKAGLDVEVLDERQLEDRGFGGITAVGMGSVHPPRLVHVSYQRRGAQRKVALIGKGITFDSGGLSLKPPASQPEMKSDMAGAAAVIAAMTALAALDPKVSVDAWVPMAENMPSGSAYRPGDVVTMYGGSTVEVLNTDAEGRMILGDAIARACEDQPDYLIETSTLTGGQITSLGHRVAGLMGEDGLRDRVHRVAKRTGEPAWPMPLPDDVRRGMESPIADIAQVNTGMDRAGHMLQGGNFLAHFVADGVAWAHLDIAGPSYVSREPYGYLGKGATGVPVRTLVAVVEDIAATG